ncbi:hypothetical protein WN51_04710 [Melipona quadrifasciata]|uniref:Uncharacterized protein n=1 Tax=Melipona quadrifasciata TaxID=166423 RepID=A0A0M9AAZ4_9HYME|nr:hypothetical protein WN51_04710 [Melipona quadrifasciata]
MSEFCKMPRLQTFLLHYMLRAQNACTAYYLVLIVIFYCHINLELYESQDFDLSFSPYHSIRIIVFSLDPLDFGWKDQITWIRLDGLIRPNVEAPRDVGGSGTASNCLKFLFEFVKRFTNLPFIWLSRSDQIDHPCERIPQSLMFFSCISPWPSSVIARVRRVASGLSVRRIVLEYESCSFLHDQNSKMDHLAQYTRIKCLLVAGDPIPNKHSVLIT